MKPESLPKLLREIRACRICEAILVPRPVLHVGATSKICIASQAPGLRVHQSGISFDDASGDRLFAARPAFDTILLVGSYALGWHLGDRRKSTMTETVKAWREYAPHFVPLPHPSWRNNDWLKKNPWFAQELLPYLRRRVRRLLAD